MSIGLASIDLPQVVAIARRRVCIGRAGVANVLRSIFQPAASGDRVALSGQRQWLFSPSLPKADRGAPAAPRRSAYLNVFRRYLVFVLLSISAVSSAMADVTGDAFTTAMDRVVEGVNRGDAQPFNDAIDADSIIKKAVDDQLLRSDWKRGLVQGARQALKKDIGDELISKIPPGEYAKVLKVQVDGRSATALVRIGYGDSGSSYLEFALSLDADGSVKIIDWYDYSTGQNYSHSLRYLIATTAPTPTAFGALIDLAKGRADVAKAIQAMVKDYRQGDYLRAVERYLSLEEKYRSAMPLVVIAVNSAIASGDSKLYLELLTDIAAHSSDNDDAAFILIDYYAELEQHGKVLAGVRKLSSRMGVEDAGLLVVKSVSFLGMAEYDKAIAAAERAIMIEPVYENAYWALLNAQIEAKRFEDATLTARVLEDAFEYEMTAEAMSGEDVFVPFIESREYREWRAKRLSGQ